MTMTKLLEEAIATVRKLPDSAQDIAAQFLLNFAQPDQARFELSQQQMTELESAIRQADEGKFATETEMEDVWQRFER